MIGNPFWSMLLSFRLEIQCNLGRTQLSLFGVATSRTQNEGVEVELACYFWRGNTLLANESPEPSKASYLLGQVTMSSF